MKQKLTIILLLTFAINQITAGQQDTYAVNKASFSSDKYDEFSPVYYRNGIVFTTNRSPNMFLNYSGPQNKGQFNINYIDTLGGGTRRKAKLLSKSLKTNLNDGPVTFNNTGDTIYYARNLRIDGKLRELSTTRNKLGIFNAVYDGKRWTRIRALRFNNEWYNISTPWLSPNGKRLYFASDKLEGFGGSDLYVCQWEGDYWNDPVNLGPVINTNGNEAYPFINSAGELFFSSDGHPGLGGKDIYFSRFVDSAWLAPVRLDTPVNSQFDDFGIITDSAMNSGYFSSKRDKTSDIYQFRTNFQQLFYSNKQRVNEYCFKFTDESNIKIDNNSLQCEWQFGDGSKSIGQRVEHCFPGPGKYLVKLIVTEKKTGREFFTKLLYNLDLKDVEQPYINSPAAGLIGDSLNFDGLKSNLPGHRILDYTWYFGDGGRVKGASVKYTFKEKGEFEVELGLTLREDSTGIIHQESVSKKISIFDNAKDIAVFINRVKESAPKVDIKSYDHAFINVMYSADNDVKQDAIFNVELMTSKTRLGVNNAIFRNIPVKYYVKEVLLPEENTYSYVIDKEMDLIATLPAYNEMITLGFKNTRVKTYVLKDPAEKEIYNLKKIFGLSVDTYFDSYNRLTSNAYILLDQVVKVLTKYPSSRFEIEVHTDNSGSPDNNLNLSQQRAQLMVNYLINKGIDVKRLTGKGFGGVRPIASNYTEADRRLNRRIDFSIII